MSDAGKKLQIDDDWKAQAEAEKERLARELEEQEAAGGPGDLPPPVFAELVRQHYIQALMGLGGVEDPRTGKPMPPDLPLARFHIELLAMLEAKTKGNLEKEEEDFLRTALYELRMAFVQVSSAIAAAMSAPPPAK